MRMRAGLLGGLWHFALAAALVLPLGLGSKLGAQVRLSLIVSPDVQSTCEPTDVRVSLRGANPASLEVAGFQFFVEYPADKLDPIDYEPGDLTGPRAANGASPFGTGFDGCAADQEDRWDDGLGRDRVAVVASAFDSPQSNPVTNAMIDFGTFVFRVRSDATLGVGEVRFATEGCSPFFVNLQNVFGPSGQFLSLAVDNAADNFELQSHSGVEDFTCEPNNEGAIVLTWNPPSSGEAQSFVVYKNGEKFRVAPTVAFTEFEDPDPPGCGEQALYEVVVVSDGVEQPCPQSCQVTGPDGNSDFIRGDVDSSGGMNITDAINLNLLLFLGVPVSCQDAADFDDSGRLDTTDTIGVLLFQFSTGRPPAAPYPDPGQDLTDDELPACCIDDPTGGNDP